MVITYTMFFYSINGKNSYFDPFKQIKDTTKFKKT